ncbi:hypothetical protein [Photobacterium sanguinicancri]|uniref:hypothetical protein n=1 Tax=Photobacterium sanguinicancri TaxID=875932 RepID=UPI002480BBC9|nr:hypothetical protein [Photobacterium sanguinicancri]
MNQGDVTVGDLTTGGSAAVGSENTVDSNNKITYITNNLHFNSPFNPKGDPKSNNGLFEQLIQETNPDTKYTVFVCAPSDSVSSDKAKYIYDNVLENLSKIGVDIIIGGGKFILDDINPYPHIYEYDLCKDSKCNSIIIIAEDHSTLSQFSLLSHLKYNNSLSNIAMYVIYEDDILNQEFMKKGPISYFEDEVKGDLVAFSKYDDDVGSVISSKITRHKLFTSNKKD